MSEEIHEAIITISDGPFTCQAFSHPCHYKVGDVIEAPLISLDQKNLFRIEQAGLMIKQVGDTFEHEIIAVVENFKARLVSVGNIKIELGGYFPGDIINGDHISFTTHRLDTPYNG